MSSRLLRGLQGNFTQSHFSLLQLVLQAQIIFSVALSVYTGFSRPPLLFFRLQGIYWAYFIWWLGIPSLNQHQSWINDSIWSLLSNWINFPWNNRQFLQRFWIWNVWACLLRKTLMWCRAWQRNKESNVLPNEFLRPMVSISCQNTHQRLWKCLRT